MVSNTFNDLLVAPFGNANGDELVRYLSGMTQAISILQALWEL